LDAVVGYQTGYVGGTTSFMLEVPDLADGTGPVKIYGYALRLFKDPDGPVGNETADATMTVQAYRENSRRGADAETGTLLPPIGSQFVSDAGYSGEFESQAWLDPKPWTWHQFQVRVIKDTPKAITMVGLDADAPNASLTYLIMTGPYHGTLSAPVGGLVTYTPTTGFTGADQFQFKVKDAEGRYSNTSLVTIGVAAP
jgi:hypothetical protein